MTIDIEFDTSNLIFTDSELENLLESLKTESCYGLDTEFIGEGKLYPKLALIQISWKPSKKHLKLKTRNAHAKSPEETTALIDPTTIDPALLSDFFINAGTAIMHSAAQDLKILKQYCGAVPNEIFDIQTAAGFIGLGHPSLGQLVNEFCETSLPKKAQLTDWLKRPLTRRQTDYARADVAYLFPIYEALTLKLKSRQRLGWAIQESEQIRQTNSKTTAPWASIRKIKTLKGRALGIAISLALWRDQKAKELNILPRKFLGDAALIVLAEMAPESMQELNDLRILKRYFNGTNKNSSNGKTTRAEMPRNTVYGEILLLVKSAKPVEEEYSEGQIPDKNQQSVFNIILAWANSYALSCDIHPALLATRKDLIEFFALNPSGRLTEGWRGELLSETLSLIAKGDASIAIGQNGNLVLEKRSGKSLI